MRDLAVTEEPKEMQTLVEKNGDDDTSSVE